MKRIRLRLKGTVQGVGFRPFVYRLAKELSLRGFIMNDPSGVLIEVEGEEGKLHQFLFRLNAEKPPLARIYSQTLEFKPPAGYGNFEIKKSAEGGRKEAIVLPDIATCEDCLRELFDPEDRRYMYPFINCTNCGPRFTIIEKLPYDRKNTTMRVFSMCSLCRKEYDDPLNRRFHAQPNACPLCGPHVELVAKDRRKLAEKEEAIELLVTALKEGRICAVKGVGGFHLMCDATREDAVMLLRSRKRRQEKPFAVMFKDIDQVEEFLSPTDLERALLISPERPIVLIEGRGKLPDAVSPGLKRTGAFLPYSPLHHIVMRKVGVPLIATSGNLSDEPIVKDNEEALNRLTSFADLILLHNRDIRRRCDDSVIKVVGGLPTPIRRSRGYVPLPVNLNRKLKRRVLAVGAMLKNTFALAFEDKVILSQHVGDVDNLSTLKVFEETVKDLMDLYNFAPEAVVCDLHPRYETTRWAKEFAKRRGIALIQVQHHYAHVLSCMAENQIEDEVLGVAWDGTGYGDDGTLWGGEFLICDYNTYRRVCKFKPFKLIGGEKAVREPYRVLLSLLFEIYGEEAKELARRILPPPLEKKVEPLYTAWRKGLNSPLTSSVGRLFDAVASLLNIKQRMSYEGQAAMMVEDLYMDSVRSHYSFEIKNGVIDWRPTLEDMLRDREREKIPSRFINTLAEIVLQVARKVGIGKVCLSGGVMQNSPLVARIKELLGREFEVFTHQRVPTNDGGISLGQAVYRNL